MKLFQESPYIGHAQTGRRKTHQMKTLTILFLTISLTACSIEAQPNEQTNEPNIDCNETPNDPNCEPNCEFTPNHPNCQPTQPTYQTCPEVSVCDGVEADCHLSYKDDCDGVGRGTFSCGDVSGHFFTDGTLFVCNDERCWEELAGSTQYCIGLKE